jgi:hypothetical protein
MSVVAQASRLRFLGRRDACTTRLVQLIFARSLDLRLPRRWRIGGVALNENPYQSPEAQDNASVQTGGPRLRWRLIPTVLLAALGGIMGIGNLAGALLLIVAPPGHVPPNATLLTCLLTESLGGVTWCASAFACWKGYWLRAAVGALAGFLLAVLSEYLAPPRHF